MRSDGRKMNRGLVMTQVTRLEKKIQLREENEILPQYESTYSFAHYSYEYKNVLKFFLWC